MPAFYSITMDAGLVLIVDDDASSRRTLAGILEHEGYRVVTVGDAFSALQTFDDLAPDLVLTDLHMSGMHGLELMRKLHQRSPRAVVVVITAFGDVESAVEAMRAGAIDYLRKPVDVGALLRCMADGVQRSRLRALASTPPASDLTRGIVGSAPEMRALLKSIGQVAPTRATVLITGESGTGKELVARALHTGSPQAAGPFVALNCAALSPTLLESELFGHERGSFTGADKRRRGRIEQAHGGTLFLDEIGEIAPALQVKLLRVLQERAFERVGGNDTIQVEVRVVAATNRDLRELVSQGVFREDLFYRLNVVGLRLPPLRERRADIPALSQHFLELLRASRGCEAPGITDAATQRLVDYHWPGNVRQLENAIECACVFAGDRAIEPGDLPAELAAPAPAAFPPLPGASMNDLERYAILKTMEGVGGSTRRTAELLGISIRKIQYRLREYGALPTTKGGENRDDESGDEACAARALVKAGDKDAAAHTTAGSGQRLH